MANVYFLTWPTLIGTDSSLVHLLYAPTICFFITFPEICIRSNKQSAMLVFLATLSMLIFNFMLKLYYNDQLFVVHELVMFFTGGIVGFFTGINYKSLLITIFSTLGGFIGGFIQGEYSLLIIGNPWTYWHFYLMSASIIIVPTLFIRLSIWLIFNISGVKDIYKPH